LEGEGIKMNEEYLSVKEFAAAAGVSTQYIYKILGSSLKPYKKKIGKQTYIEKAAVQYIKEGFPSEKVNQPMQPDATNQMQPSENADMQPDATNEQPTNATDTTNQPEKELQSSKEIEVLRLLVEELQAEKEELKKDKEYLKQEANKWQQLLIDERNKVKLLEAAAEKQQEKEEIEIEEVTEIKEAAAEEVVQQDQQQPDQGQQDQQLPKTFFARLKWLFKGNNN